MLSVNCFLSYLVFAKNFPCSWTRFLNFLLELPWKTTKLHVFLIFSRVNVGERDTLGKFAIMCDKNSCCPTFYFNRPYLIDLHLVKFMYTKIHGNKLRFDLRSSAYKINSNIYPLMDGQINPTAWILSDEYQ